MRHGRAVPLLGAGVFVDNAGAAAKTQRDYIIEKDARVKLTTSEICLTVE